MFYTINGKANSFISSLDRSMKYLTREMGPNWREVIFGSETCLSFELESSTLCLKSWARRVRWDCVDLLSPLCFHVCGRFCLAPKLLVYSSRNGTPCGPTNRATNIRN